MFILWAGKGIESASCVPAVVRRPLAMGPEGTCGEPPLCPSKFQELAEPEPLETDVAFVSILHVRAVRELTVSVTVLTFGSIAANNAILEERALTVCSTLVILEVTIPTASHRVLVVEICESTSEW